MPQGAQVWDSSGVLQMDTTEHFGRIFGVAATAALTAGSVTDADFTANGGTAFWFVVPLGATVEVTPPKITVSGNTVSWDATGSAVYIHYGSF